MTTPTRLLEERKAALLPVLLEAAAKGERCPTNLQLQVRGYPGSQDVVSALAREGTIRVEIYARNWRVIEIVATGERTQRSPLGAEPYLVVDQSSPP